MYFHNFHNLFIYLFIYLYIYLFVYLFVCLFIYLFIYFREKTEIHYESIYNISIFSLSLGMDVL